MKEPEIEAEIRNDTVWRRPTWPMGGNARTLRSPFDRVNLNDSFGIFGETRVNLLLLLKKLNMTLICAEVLV